MTFVLTEVSIIFFGVLLIVGGVAGGAVRDDAQRVIRELLTVVAVPL